MNQPLVRELNTGISPAEVCAALEGLPLRILFDSADRSDKYGRYSFVAADPELVIAAKAKHTEIRSREGVVLETSTNGDAFTFMRKLLSAKDVQRVADLPPFQGGFAGYVGYEFASSLENIRPAADDDLHIPDLYFGYYDTVFAWDHALGRAWLLSGSKERQQIFFDRLLTPPVDKRTRSPSASPAAGSSLSRTDYRSAIETIREYIAAGDIFQANFAQRFTSPFVGTPWDLYLALRERNPAPFACFFEADGISILSASPERFVKVDSSRTAQTRPIKGTRPRMRSLAEDHQAQSDLLDSAKDNAEHVMIVDVLRNDLSRVCSPGSITVTHLAELESHPTVHHLVSTVEGTLRSDCDSIDLLLASLPGGSITGAPKIRAMEIISELEPVRRDVYCGCMAYLTPDGLMDSSIVIRTFIARGDHVFFSAGGGIVADSDAELEYQETLHKAAALFSALEAN